MSFMYVLVASCCLSCVYSAEVFWKLDNDNDNVISFDCQLKSEQIASVIKCAHTCVNNQQCKSFFYNKTNKTCLLNSKIINGSQELQESIGTRLYYLTADGSSCISKCPGYTYLGTVDKCIKLPMKATGNWSSAEQQCQLSGGRLAVVKTEKMRQSVMKVIQSTLGDSAKTSGFWVAAMYRETVENFVWIDDGSTIAPSLWHPGQPESIQGSFTSKQCVILAPGKNYKLINEDCNISFETITPLCECFK